MCDVFGVVNSTKESIEAAGIKLFITMYNGRDGNNVTKLRYQTFMEHAVSCKAHDPASLPPSERSAIYHAHRVHYQVCQWKALSTSVLNPTEWGWVLQGGSLYPIKSDVPPAPEELLKFMRCNCKLSSKNTCGTLSCSCKKHGLKCVKSCGDCHGESCNNQTFDICLESDNDDEVLHLERVFECNS